MKTAISKVQLLLLKGREIVYVVTGRSGNSYCLMTSRFQVSQLPQLTFINRQETNLGLNPRTSVYFHCYDRGQMILLDETEVLWSSVVHLVVCLSGDVHMLGYDQAGVFQRVHVFQGEGTTKLEQQSQRIQPQPTPFDTYWWIDGRGQDLYLNKLRNTVVAVYDGETGQQISLPELVDVWTIPTTDGDITVTHGSNITLSHPAGPDNSIVEILFGLVPCNTLFEKLLQLVGVGEDVTFYVAGVDEPLNFNVSGPVTHEARPLVEAEA